MKRLNRLLYLLAFLKFLLPFFLQSSVYEPHRDEFLYLAEGGHPAFGFMEVPPLLIGLCVDYPAFGKYHVLDQMLALSFRGTQFYPGWQNRIIKGWQCLFPVPAFLLFYLQCLYPCPFPFPTQFPGDIFLYPDRLWTDPVYSDFTQQMVVHNGSRCGFWIVKQILCCFLHC